MERMRAASAISKEEGRDEGLRIARESLAEVRDLIQGVQVSAPFGNVKYALEVFSARWLCGSEVSRIRPCFC
jgi:homocysteine S-methyltransferase